ncbi:MAG: PAS domain-containing sensor histidine kinase [Alphaproteobacteria bacterium]
MSLISKAQHTAPSPQSDNSEAARCAINEEGYLVYANNRFCELTGIQPDTHHHILEILQFTDELNENLDQSDDLSIISAGSHDVHIVDNGIMTEFHFDWLSMPDNRLYLIASAIDHDALETNSDDDIDTLMSKIHNSSARINALPTGVERLNNKEQTPPNSSINMQDYKAFMELSKDFKIITDLQGRIIHTSNAFIKLSGATKTDEIIGTSFYDLFNPEEQPDIQNLITHTGSEPSNSPSIASYESTMYNAQSGDELSIEWRCMCHNDKIYISGRDTTDIKEKQYHLERRERQLSEAEAIGRMGHWYWLIGEDEITWSEEIFRIFGVNQHSFAPSIHSLGDLVHRRDLGRVIQVFQRAMIEEKNYDMEFRVIRPDGKVRFVMCEGRCEKNQYGEVIALYGIIQDMTERMLYEQELRRAKDASEQAYAAKSRFLTNMSHELRTPLNAIIGFSEMIESQMLGPIFNEKYLEYATSIKDSGHHLLDLISDILDMSKIEAGKYALDLEELEIKKIIERAMEMVETRAKEQNVRLRRPIFEHDNLTLLADRRALMQIFLNLLSNAVKFTKSGGSVWMECYEYEDVVSFKVCDTGIGIPPNKLASVLHPFEQASNEYTSDYEGTGLGLSITKELVEMHGGTLNIESSINIGTTVNVRLPYEATIKHVA